MKLKRFTMQLVVAGLIAVPPMAHAAGLGKLSVTSALGQPLAAEIELFAANKAELDSISVNLASDQAYRDARIDYAPILTTLRFTVVRKPDGKAVLKVTTPRPVNDPFIDMLVELNWASGRLVREYTMLLDPPGTAVAQTVSPVVVETTPAAAAQSETPEPTAAYALENESEPAAEPVAAQDAEPAVRAAETPAERSAADELGEYDPSVASSRPAVAEDELADDEPVVADAVAPRESARASSRAASSADRAASRSASAPSGDVKVKRGDTLTHIAQRVRPDSVSLEQTLIALYRENPHAFVGNVNRLKAGATLKVPSADAVAEVKQQEAARELKLQAEDWRAYRQKLAADVAAAPETQADAGQASSGKITPKVEDRAEPAPSAQQDVLKLSKVAPAAGAAKTEQDAAGESGEEDAIASEKAMEEAGQRAAFLEKQVGDLQKLTELQNSAAEAEAAPADAGDSGDAALAEGEGEGADASLAPLAVDAPKAAPEPSENWYDPVLADPMYWGAGAAVLGLGGLLWWMMAGGRRQKVSAEVEDSLIGSGNFNLAQSGGNASGGSVNTGDSSFLTDFSQAGLGAIDTHDVDPIAEAEVYMAYGRDAQAEEILKEAIGKTPDRHEIRVKLLEIYAARRNAAAFGSAAGELYAALGGKSGPLWDKVCEMGRSVDPTNPLYGDTTPAATPSFPPAATFAATAGIAGGAVAFADEPVVPKSIAAKPAPEPFAPPPPPPAPVAPAPVVSAPIAPPPVAAPAPAPEPEPVFEFALDDSSLEFESAGSVLSFEAPAKTAAASVPALDADTEGLSFELPDFDIPASAAAKADSAGDAPSFDFGGFDLDLGGTGDDLDEVGTKLDLARAYVEMGDKEGAREILNEVLAEGDERQKADAKGIMSSLG